MLYPCNHLTVASTPTSRLIFLDTLIWTSSLSARTQLYCPPILILLMVNWKTFPAPVKEMRESGPVSWWWPDQLVLSRHTVGLAPECRIFTRSYCGLSMHWVNYRESGIRTLDREEKNPQHSGNRICILVRQAQSLALLGSGGIVLDWWFEGQLH